MKHTTLRVWGVTKEGLCGTDNKTCRVYLQRPLPVEPWFLTSPRPPYLLDLGQACLSQFECIAQTQKPCYRSFQNGEKLG